MRIFYMERGAGASNLHMKFNLAAVKKGTVELTKELKGVSSSESTYALFPYKIFYTMEDDPATEDVNESTIVKELRNAYDKHTVSDAYNALYPAPESMDYVFIKDSTLPVTFLPEVTVNGVTYYNVFMLKPDDQVVINFPTVAYDPNSSEEYTVDKYRIVECGIDPEVYTEVKANDVVLSGDPLFNDPNDPNYVNLRDYGIEMATTDARPRVKYVNKVETLNKLEIQKELWRKYDSDINPEQLLPINPNISDPQPGRIDPLHEQKFNYRLYFKTPIDSDFQPAAYYVYHVKDPDGYYCRYNKQAETFERIKGSDMIGDPDAYLTGTKDFSKLTDDPTDVNGNPLYDGEGNKIHGGKFYASFETSPNGSISDIPAYYTVEVLELIPGTEYKLVERPSETPDGYKFYQYRNNENTVHTDPYDPSDGIEGTISSTPDTDSDVVVRNYKGYGLRLEKVWADATSIENREPTYFAVYTVDENGAPVALVPDSVQRLAYTADQSKQQLYWWYLDLPVANTGLMDYAVFEVVLEGNPTITDGVVSGYTDIHPVIEDSGLVTLYGTISGQTSSTPIEYEVTYADPELIGTNVRKFKATNKPAKLPPIRIEKTDWSGTALPGADFTLKYGEDLASSLFNPETMTSDENGLVAQVYLQVDEMYTLTEVKTPQGYVGLQTPLVIKLRSDASLGWQLDVTPEIPSGYPQYYQVVYPTTSDSDVITLVVKNHPYELTMVKVDSIDTTKRIKGVKFSLFKKLEVAGSNTWDEENPVYTNLTTDENGVIPNINASLPAGTYQLRETGAPNGYQTLTGNIDFTIDASGVITLGSHPDDVTLSSTTGEDGKVVYEVTIPNTPQPLKLKKVDQSGKDLTGAKFTLYNDTNKKFVVLGSDGTYGESNESSEIDMTTISLVEMKDLPLGNYKLTETVVPDGYIMTDREVYFKIENKISSGQTRRVVSLTNSTWTKTVQNSSTVKLTSSGGVYTIQVTNTAGTVLPSTGGGGIKLYTVIGLGLVASCAVVAWIRFRRREREI